MVGTIVRIGVLEMKRAPVEILVSFVVPIVFFSIFALIFGGQGSGGGVSSIRTVLVDEDQSEVSRRFLEGLAQEDSVRIHGEEEAEAVPTFDRERAEQLVKEGEVSVAVIIPAGFGDSFGGFIPQTGSGENTVEMLVDPSNPIAPQMLNGLMQKVAMTSVTDIFLTKGIEQFEQFGGPLTEQQESAVDTWIPMLQGLMSGDGESAEEVEDGSEDGGGNGEEDSPLAAGLVPVKVTEVLGQEKDNPTIAFFAAGIAVMFMLFAAAGAGGSLLDEEANNTLERLLATQVTMSQLLLGKWIFLILLGVAQIVVMFLWGQLVFGVELFSHLPGFFLMTIATAAAASSLGLLLATVCRSRAQLSGISTIVILTMSALGGSMVPRFVMPESMQRVGIITFNAWALDGFQKVFWFETPLWSLWPQLLVLGLMAVGFLAIARLFARRWETI